MLLMIRYRNEIDKMLQLISGSAFSTGWYWSSTEYSSNYVWYVYGGSGNVLNGNGKTDAGKVRPCVACAAN